MPTESNKALTRGERSNLITRADVGDMKLKTALFVLDQYGGQIAGQWPSMDELANAMCCSLSTARRAIRTLAAMGLIEYSDLLPDKASRTYWIKFDQLAASTQPASGIRIKAGQIDLASQIDAAGQIDRPQSGRGASESRPVKLTGHNKQTTVQRKREEQNKKTSALQIVGLSDSEKIRRVKIQLTAMPRAVQLLKSQGVWANQITDLIRIAAAADTVDGNPMPRLMQVVKMAMAAGDAIGSRPAWIVKALQKNWKPNR